MALAAIQNVLSGKVKNPQQGTIDGIKEALARLEGKRTVSEEEEESEEDEYYDLLPMKESIGKVMKRITLFDPHDDEQIASLSGITCVYMFYAGGNNLVAEEKIRLAGTPEYSTKNFPRRINDHRQKWWRRDDWIDYGVCIDEQSGLHLEKIFIRVLSPSLNKNA